MRHFSGFRKVQTFKHTRQNGKGRMDELPAFRTRGNSNQFSNTCNLPFLLLCLIKLSMDETELKALAGPCCNKEGPHCCPPEVGVRECHSINLVFPFKDAEQARIVQASLMADPEPERSQCMKAIDAIDGELRVLFMSPDLKHLRNAVTNFYELFDLVLQTIDQFSLDKLPKPQ